MNNRTRDSRLTSDPHNLAGGIALGETLVSGREAQPGRRSKRVQWAAVLALAIALAPGAVSASSEEDDTVTVSGVFNMDQESGSYYVSPDLWAAFVNGYQHTWTLTLHGTTQSHSTNGSYYRTDILATSFELEFFGPDAALLNGFVSDYLADGVGSVQLQNTYDGNGGGSAIMGVSVGYNGYYFYSGHNPPWGADEPADTLFPADAGGYPVVGQQPFSFEAPYTDLGYFDWFSGWGGGIGSSANPVTFQVMPSLPQLTITRSNNGVLVSWPSPYTGFSLQQNSQLNTSNWVTPAESVTDNGTIKFIVVDPPTGSRFYRLFKP